MVPVVSRALVEFSVGPFPGGMLMSGAFQLPKRSQTRLYLVEGPSWKEVAGPHMRRVGTSS
jgi:hypothetical protein